MRITKIVQPRTVKQSNAARDQRRAEARQRICEWNGHPYIAKNVRGKYCPDHTPKRSRSTNPEATPFIAIDGEGQSYGCLELYCTCLFYIHYCIGTEDECIVKGLHEICSLCGHRKYVNDFKEPGGHAHSYPLLGVGKEQLINEDGSDLQWWQIYSHLYNQFLVVPRQTAFVGFSLGYDFTMWHKTMPWDRAAALLNPSDKNYIARRKTSSTRRSGNNEPFPMQITAPEGLVCPIPIRDGGNIWQWQSDMLGNMKRFKLRPQPCACKTSNCIHMGSSPVPWMYVCDVFPFFQKSFLAVIKDIPGIPDEIREEIREGKNNRASAILGETMKHYNVLENETLALRVMPMLDEGFQKMGIKLSKKQWFGPGQASGIWLAGTNEHKRAPKRVDLWPTLPDRLMDDMQSSFQAGWWDIFAHGHIPNESHIYDINSSYPHDISQLPCLGIYVKKNDRWVFRSHGRWHYVKVDLSHPEDARYLPSLPDRTLALVRAYVTGHDKYIGAMLHRDVHGYISRPHTTGGWYWLDELQAAIEAGLVDEALVTEWWFYEPTCNCPSPLAEIKDLYALRLEYSKNSSLGMAARLGMNSAYGKTVQSVGDNPPFTNWIYGSRITSRTRTKILKAIASHKPYGTKDILMISTDAFVSKHEHPSLPITDKLGDWSHNTLHNLTLAKPGFWWTDEAREALAKGMALKSKQRGISAEAFKKGLPEFDHQFNDWRGPNQDGNGWPVLTMELGFAMMTAKQALHQNCWENAGRVVNRRITIDTASNMNIKRDPGFFDDEYGIYRSLPKVSVEYTESYGFNPAMGVAQMRELGLQDPDAIGITPDGTWELLRSEAMG